MAMSRRRRRCTSCCGSSQTAAIDPLTSQLIYLNPSSSSTTGFSTTPLFSPATPRSLPTPPVLGPGKQISISHDGEWIVIYHFSLSHEGGTLAIYSSSILSPASTSSSVIPLAKFALKDAPLATQHLYPARTYLTTGRVPPLGPRAPPSHDPSHGPTFLVLTSTCLLLLHPHLLPSTVQLDTIHTARLRDSPDSPQWGMNILRCPLRMRWHATVGETPAPEMGERARRGCLGMVGGNEAIWCVFEWGREVGFVRAEVGVDGIGRYYLQTTPMPPLPRLRPPPFADAEERQVDAELQGVVFIPLTDEVRGPIEGRSKSLDSVAAVLLYEDSLFGPSSSSSPSLATATRTRIEIFGFEKREVELVEGFGEIGSVNGDVATSRDWFALPRPLRTTLSPISTSIITLSPLPVIPPHTLALALLSTPDGMRLAHIDLTDNSLSAVGGGMDLGDTSSTGDVGLVTSGSAARGLMGLVALVSEDVGAMLVVPPRLNATVTAENGQELCAGEAAEAIVLAIKQGVDWSNVVRAGLGAAPKAQVAELVPLWLRKIWDLLMDTPGLYDLEEILRVQVALLCWTADDPQREIAAELLRLMEASHLFNECATFKDDGTVFFDLDAVWPLVGVAEWVMTVLARAMREIVVDQAKADWGEGKEDKPSARILYFIHPTLRPVIIQLLSQIDAFTSSVCTLDRPILQPESRFMPLGVNRDPRATVVARERLEALAIEHGVNIAMWGKALETVTENQASEADLQSSLLNLNPAPLRPFPTLPDPSSLFCTTTIEEEYDAVTFLPHTGKMSKCNRCGWKTAALGQAGLGNSGEVLGGWRKWRRERERRCGCGGCWVPDGRGR